jgi:hypothetical protein
VASGKRTRRKTARASAGYTVGVVGLVALAAFLALSLEGRFAPPPSRQEQITVLVLNGCGAEGVGQETARLLRTSGIDVIDFRNADSFRYPETIVVDRAGDMAAAARVARLLGVTNVIQQIPEAPLADVAVVVGKDYERILNRR